MLYEASYEDGDAKLVAQTRAKLVKKFFSLLNCNCDVADATFKVKLNALSFLQPPQCALD